MLRFAVDPALKTGAESDMTPVGAITDFGPEPKRIDFKVKQKDGWYETEATLSAWVTVDKGGNVLALSPVCKHLGCTVNWNGDSSHPNQYFCPCHGGRYEINGKNVPNTPPPLPLDEYTTEVKDGKLYLGQIVPNRLTKEA
jgi:menaquinol-cytochrome c reductase iron-sulfur subunit